jgi:hypothetical protein
MAYRSYHVRIGDVEAPYEFVKEDRADAFARGARHVLDNIKHYESTKVTVLTYQEVADPGDDDKPYHETVVNSKEY